jgi:enediyne biosynthesis protein E4
MTGGRTVLSFFVILLGLATTLLGCQRSAPSVSSRSETEEPPWFEDVTDAVGLKFHHDAGPTGAYFLPQIIGSGAALFDLDQDGRLDLYLIQNAGPKGATNRLFRQRDDGTFENISAGSGLDVAGHGMGVAIGDVNNDGWPDVVLTGYRGVRLFLNNGNRTFTEATREAGLDSVHWATSASFVDFDRDGWLDLVVVHYVGYDPAHRDFCHPGTFPGTIAHLYRNRGKRPNARVVFEDVTVKSGLAQRPGPGLGVLCADFNGDGWPDIFIANDAQPNHLWINQRDGTFVEEAVLRGCAYNAVGRPEGNMGIAFGDVDGDGLPDLFVTHLTEETNTLWKQGPLGMFRDRTAAAGLASPRWRGTGFGVVMADFNQDGHLDLALVNGRVARSHGTNSSGFEWNDYTERNQLFGNDGSGKFRDLSPANPAFAGMPGIGRGLCGGDICGNGRIDLLATYVNGPARLYRNVAPDAGHWLMVRAVVPEWNRDAYGAQVTVTAGERRWTRLIQPGSSYLCSNDPRAHFGLGNVDRIDCIRVTWPDGVVEEFPGGAVDRRVNLRKGEGIKKQ